MPQSGVSLHAISVGTYLQILPALSGMIDKAEAFCREAGSEGSAMAEACLAADMWPFAKQVTSAVHHSAGTIRGLRLGELAPELEPAPLDLPVLRQLVIDAIAFLQSVTPAEIDAMMGRDMRFALGSRRMDFTAEDFILTFSLPNFYFHASTAYGVLRNQGVPLGKADFLGQLRLKS